MKKIILVFTAVIISNLIYCQLNYRNPILSGFYPDPSICRVGEDYYIVNSSFSYFPGLPIFHSKDLVNWKLLGHAMDRKEQLNLENAGVSRGLFAPTIRYHKGTFYIICTLIDKGGNFIITAKNPKGPWSNPAWLPEVNGIDPSLYFDEDDKAYVLFNSIPPNNISVHDGHRTIRMFELNITTLKVTGQERLLVNGGTDMTKKPVWIEGPHIFKKDGWYYLICAEGGTGYNHSEVVFRSRDIEGPYIPWEKNPILTQRHLNPERKNPITTTGHADFVETPDGKWYAVFLGCRPYDGDYYNTGRETFMTPVEWKEGWPVINPGHEEVQYQYAAPGKVTVINNNYNANVYYKNTFENKALDPRFVFLRNTNDGLYSLKNRKGYLSLPLKGETVSGKGNPAFIGFRQHNLEGYAITSLSFDPQAPNEKAGIIIFQNEKAWYFLCKSVVNHQPVIQLYNTVSKDEFKPELLAEKSLSSNGVLQLKIEARRDRYDFYFSTTKDEWTLLMGNLDGKYLSTKSAGGFVGCMYGLYATSLGEPSKNSVQYDWFEYKGNDAVYR